MISVISAKDSTLFYINHKKIETIKVFNSNVYITLDTGRTFIILDSVDNVISRILEFESLLNAKLMTNLEEFKGVTS